MLERVGMGARVGSMPHMLSSGQQQWVALACALVFDTKGLLLSLPYEFPLTLCVSYRHWN